MTEREGENMINTIRGDATVALVRCLDVTGHLVIILGVSCVGSLYVDLPSV